MQRFLNMSARHGGCLSAQRGASFTSALQISSLSLQELIKRSIKADPEKQRGGTTGPRRTTATFDFCRSSECFSTCACCQHVL